MCFQPVEHCFLRVKRLRLKNCQYHIKIAVLLQQILDVVLGPFAKPFDVSKLAAELTLCTVQTDILLTAFDTGCLRQRRKPIIKHAGPAECHLFPGDLHTSQEILKLRQCLGQLYHTVCTKDRDKLLCRSFLGMRCPGTPYEEL